MSGKPLNRMAGRKRVPFKDSITACCNQTYDLSSATALSVLNRMRTYWQHTKLSVNLCVFA